MAIGPAAEHGWHELSGVPSLAAVLPGQACMLQLTMPPPALLHVADIHRRYRGSGILLEVTLFAQHMWAALAV